MHTQDEQAVRKIFEEKNMCILEGKPLMLKIKQKKLEGGTRTIPIGIETPKSMIVNDVLVQNIYHSSGVELWNNYSDEPFVIAHQSKLFVYMRGKRLRPTTDADCDGHTPTSMAAAPTERSPRTLSRSQTVTRRGAEARGRVGGRMKTSVEMRSSGHLVKPTLMLARKRNGGMLPLS